MLAFVIIRPASVVELAIAVITVVGPSVAFSIVITAAVSQAFSVQYVEFNEESSHSELAPS